MAQIVYLFGAGATHAEKQLGLQLAKVSDDATSTENTGLLARDVSKRVFETVLKQEPRLAKKYGITQESFSDPLDTTHEKFEDFELFVSLIQTIKTRDSEGDASMFREYFKKDILKNLKVNKKRIAPKLYASLIEYHKYSDREVVLGYLTLNYETLFEESFRLVERHFNYGLNVINNNPALPLRNEDEDSVLLKLHGSFNWIMDSNMNRIFLSLKKDSIAMQWVPPGLNKDYLNYPYNLVHGRAYELLGQCDILRVIGCSLNKNDIGLISLLFRTQKLRHLKPFVIEIIAGEKSLQGLEKSLGGLLSFNESFYRTEEWSKLGVSVTNNHFMDWLYYKSKYLAEEKLAESKYLKNLRAWGSYE